LLLSRRFQLGAAFFKAAIKSRDKVCYPISPQRRMVFKYWIRKVFGSILDSCKNVLVFLMHETVSLIEVHQDDPPAAASRK